VAQAMTARPDAPEGQDSKIPDVVQLMLIEQAKGEQTLPFFKWYPVETRTGETIYRLWILTGWTNKYVSIRS
jgi:hypothetical protein